jgi:hypothetical protein
MQILGLINSKRAQHNKQRSAQLPQQQSAERKAFPKTGVLFLRKNPFYFEKNTRTLAYVKIYC